MELVFSDEQEEKLKECGITAESIVGVAEAFIAMGAMVDVLRESVMELSDIVSMQSDQIDALTLKVAAQEVI